MTSRFFEALSALGALILLLAACSSATAPSATDTQSAPTAHVTQAEAAASADETVDAVGTAAAEEPTPTPVQGAPAVEAADLPFNAARSNDDGTGPQPNPLGVAALTNGDTEPFYMVNLITYRDLAVYPDGRETDLTGAEADALYGDAMFSTILPAIGAEVVYAADVEQDMFGARIDRIGIVRYPSRQALLEMTQREDFQEFEINKWAGIESTTVMITHLLSGPELPPVADPPFPATASDAAFDFIHVLDYRDLAEYADGDADADPNRTGSEAVAKYSANAGTVALPLGVRPMAWFEVEAVMFGDEAWEEVRINAFPSHETFRQLTADPVWASGSHHRRAGLAKTHALMSAPRLNSLY